jgi:hypothetical protein
MFIASRIETAFIMQMPHADAETRGAHRYIHQPMQEGGERMCGNASATAYAGQA